MRDFSDSPTPLAITRPRGARLLQARSPKLGRLVQHYDRASFQHWICLEADPTVSAFCERPARLSLEPTSQLISYWVRRKGVDEFVMLVAHEVSVDLPDKHDGKSMRTVTATELRAAAVWIDNWQRMLPVINCAATLAPPALKQSILDLVSTPITLMALERELFKAQPMLLRAAIFDLLRTGGISAPSLRTERLSLHTILEPVQ